VIVDVDVAMVEAQLLTISRLSTGMLLHADRIEDREMVEMAGAMASAASCLIMMFDAQESVDAADGIPIHRPDTDDPETCGHSQVFDLPGGQQELCQTCGASRNPDGSWSVW